MSKKLVVSNRSTSIVRAIDNLDTSARLAAKDYSDKYNLNVPMLYGAIYNKVTGTMIPFLVPESVSRDHSANITEKTTEARSQGVPYYSGGSIPTYSFTVTVHEDFYGMILEKTGEDSANLEQNSLATSAGASLTQVVAALQALTYPEYINGNVSAPECVVYLGASATFVGRCTSVGTTLKGNTGINKHGDLSYRVAEISLSFSVIKEVVPSDGGLVPSASDIQNRRGAIKI